MVCILNQQLTFYMSEVLTSLMVGFIFIAPRDPQSEWFLILQQCSPLTVQSGAIQVDLVSRGFVSPWEGDKFTNNFIKNCLKMCPFINLEWVNLYHACIGTALQKCWQPYRLQKCINYRCLIWYTSKIFCDYFYFLASSLYFKKMLILGISHVCILPACSHGIPKSKLYIN